VGARKRTLAWRGVAMQDSPSRRLPGGALDGIKKPKKCFVIRDGGEMENHFECLWSLFRAIPSLAIEGASGFCPRNAGDGAVVS
jgi:MCRA family